MLEVAWYIWEMSSRIKLGAESTRIYLETTRNLESTFIEVCNPKITNVIIGYIYKHPNVDINEFSDDYLNELLDKLSK